MEVTPEIATAIFQEREPLPVWCSELLRERGKAFIETIVFESERFTGEENPRFEIEGVGGL